MTRYCTLLMLFAVFFSAKVIAQSCHNSGDTICTPSDTLTQTEYVPGYDELPCAIDGVPYSQIIDVHAPSTFDDDGVSVTVQSIVIQSISNLPCNLCWATNSPKDSLLGGKTLCIRVSGTTLDAPGQYLINVTVLAHVLIEGIVPETVTENLNALGLNYYIRVGQTNDACATVDTNATGNTVTNSSAITTPTISGKTIVCSGSTDTLTATGASYYAYHWSNGSATSSAVVTAAGTYSVTVYDNCNSATASVTVTSGNTTPAITAGGDTTFCQGDSVTLTATAGNAYSWSPGGATTQSFSAKQTGDYVVTVTNSNGCLDASSAITVTANPNPTPSISANGSTTICQGDSVMLTSTAETSYSWNTSATTQSIEAKTTGSYTVSVTNSNGCKGSSAPTSVTVNQPVSTPVSASICQGTSYNFNGRILTSANTYTDSLTGSNGCDSVVVLTLTVKPVSSSTVNAGICAGASYNFNGRILTAANTYYDTLTAVNGCDSIVTLNLTVKPTAASTINDSICAGASYNFNGRILTAANTYYDTLTAANGCDSIVTLNLTVKPTASSTVNDSICQGSSYNFNGKILTSANTYFDTLSAANGCDSVVTLKLYVKPVYSVAINDSICQGSTYNFNGRHLTTGGLYTDTLTASNGCDSVVALTLFIKQPTSYSYGVNLCTGQYYLFNGDTLTASNTYIDTFTAANGCDSIVTLLLVVNQPSFSSMNASICVGGSYNFDGDTLTVAGTYYDTLQNTNGCDSIIALNLQTGAYATRNYGIVNICQASTYSFYGQTLGVTGLYADTFSTAGACDSIVTVDLHVNQPIYDTLNEAICQGNGYNFNGQVLTATGTYYDTTANVDGCNNYNTLFLVVNQPTFNTIDTSFCAGSSLDINGKAYATGGTYYDTLTNVNNCDSVVTINVTELQPSFDTINASICLGSTYAFGGQNYSSTGAYRQVLVAANGCDSTVILNLTVNPPIVVSSNDTICTGHSYNFNGKILTAGGTYSDTFLTVANCDSIVTVNLTVIPPATTTLYDTICAGNSFNFDGKTLFASGAYYDTLTGSNTCDSIIALNLQVNESTSSNVQTSICAGSIFTYDGKNYSAEGIYYDTLSNAVGCDSIITIVLIVNQPIENDLDAHICTGSTFPFNGRQISKAGTYTDTLTALSTGCDSIVILNLTVDQPYSDTINVGICIGTAYNFNGVDDSVSGVYIDTLTAVTGCDSIVTLNLTVSSTFHDTVIANICAGSSYSFNSQSYTAAGVYSDSFTTVSGCDSITTLVLAVGAPSLDTINVHTCVGNGYVVNGITYTSTGQYTDTVSTAGCDSIVTLNLVVDSLPTVVWKFYYDTVCVYDTVVLTGGSPAGGRYSGVGVVGNIFHADSVFAGSFDTLTYTYTDSITGCSDTASFAFFVNICEGINTVNIEQSITLYPNPAGDLLIIQSDLFANQKITPMVYDVTGRMMDLTFVQQGNKIGVNTAGLARGTYFVRLNIDGAQVNKRFVKVE